VQQAPARRSTDDTLAIVSLVLGVVSWIMGFFLWMFGLGIFLVHFVVAIPAVVCGHLQKKRIRKDAEAYGGGGLATAGLVLGYLNIAFSLIGTLLAILFFAAFIGLGIFSASQGY
jgi:hypothetical protein